MGMKKIVSIFIGLFFLSPAYARHIRGGEISYVYVGPGSSPNTSQYRLIVKLYIDCNQNDPGQRPGSISLTVFRNGSSSPFGPTLNANKIGEQRIAYDPASNPCIVNPPTDICYDLFTYGTDVELPDDPNGYIVSYQRCCRINNIENIFASGSTGGTYLCEIPGTNTLPSNQHNSSPLISGNDAVAICAGSGFTFDFSATDLDGDSLIYVLCDAYLGASTGAPAPPVAAPPPYSSVSYRPPYSGASPFGPQATINRFTGILSGTAPRLSVTGGSNNQYVVTSCIYEYRKGKLINIHRKDIHLKVSDCNPLKADLLPDYAYCDDFLVTFKNEQVNPPGSVYIWQFGDGTKADTSLDPLGTVQHQYAVAGTYNIKVKVILAGQCTDSTVSKANVYPGFFPGFEFTGSCLFTNFGFRDTTRTRYGSTNKWRWNFADETTLADTSRLKTPSWRYNTLGTKRVELIVQSDRGCIDTVYKDVEVKDKPTLGIPFRDTLICSNAPIQDTLQLVATGLGNFSWAPNTRIINENTATPLVFPTSTTIYRVQLNENGCIASDSIRVRVVDRVTVDAGPDAVICLTDPVTLQPSGDGLAFAWSPAATLDNPNKKNPVATPISPFTTYTLVASIGKCNASSDVIIRAVPYPTSNAGAPQTKCYEDTVQLNGSIVGSSFSWIPATGLNNNKILNPLAYPRRTTAYVLQVFDILGCPKPGLDTVVVTVRPPVIAFAGNDTSVVVNQPLKLNAGGAELFLWSPPNFLSSTISSSPTALFPATGIYKYAVRVYTPEDCFSIDSITIKVFDTSPDIFVPTAFTPGKGGPNSFFKPIPVGITRLDFFRVFNRWGQLMYSNKDVNPGWDGNAGGTPQRPGTYVWIVQGTDFAGKRVYKKGTMILIR
jgi:gliding motility-associated-like protein